MNPPSKKKLHYPVTSALQAYLRAYERDIELSVDYESLRRFSESFPCMDRAGQDSHWLTVTYPPGEMRELNEGLRRIYAQLRAYGDMTVVEHLRVSRIDFCEFGNSQPFRIRIIFT